MQYNAALKPAAHDAKMKMKRMAEEHIQWVARGVFVLDMGWVRVVVKQGGGDAQDGVQSGGEDVMPTKRKG